MYKRQRVTITVYEQGTPRVVSENDYGGVVEIALEDGRQVQVSFGSQGHLSLRAWGNVPAKLGNRNSTSLHTTVEKEKPTHNPITFDRLNND